MPGTWHHVTQRGNHQETVFFGRSDWEFYLKRLHHYCGRQQVRIAGYCLMPNHVHLIAIPASESGLAKALGRTHNDYARWLNLRRETTGHVWQNRFYSCPMDEAHGWEALRYVELNPVHAGLVNDAAGWQWSSAAAHVGGRDPWGFLDTTEWSARWSSATWREALQLGLQDAALLARIREATRTGRPAAGEPFLDLAETAVGRSLRLGKPGRKPGSERHGAGRELGIA